MKILIAALSCIVSLSTFAQNPDFSKEKLETIANDISQIFGENEGESITPFICENGVCKAEIIKNFETIEDVFFRGEINPVNGATKGKIEIVSRLNDDKMMLILVCLSNNECNFFESYEVELSDYAFENGIFK